MKPTHCMIFAAVLGGLASGLLAGEKTYKQPVPEKEKWEVRLSMPLWVAGVEGTTGINGSNSDMALGFGEIIPHVDMGGSFRAEVRKGRFGFYGDFLYLSISDGIGGDGLVKKISVREDEYLGDLGLSWKLIENEHGYLEVIGGVRYVNLFEEVILQGNDQRIDTVSTRLAAAGTAARVLLARELVSLSGRDPKVPIAPVAGPERNRIVAAIQRIRGDAAERKERIERKLQSALNTRVAIAQDWWDPYIGLRGHYRLSEKYYLTARADIGGFGVGSDLSWSAYAGIGCRLSPRTFLEVTYRALGMDYDHDGFVYDMVTHGPEINLGFIF